VNKLTGEKWMLFKAQVIGQDGKRKTLAIPAEEAKVTVICGGAASFRSEILRCLSGLDGKAGLATEKSGSTDLSSLTRACLPPVGKEVFAGATVGEELVFGSDVGTMTSGDGLSTEQRFLRDRFDPIRQRSVWELSSAERRLLLLASQAVLKPYLWLCDEPLACLDGNNQKAVLDFLAGCKSAGAVIIVSVTEPAAMGALADTYVILGSDGCIQGVWDRDGKPVGDVYQAKKPAILWFTGLQPGQSA